MATPISGILPAQPAPMPRRTTHNLHLTARTLVCLRTESASYNLTDTFTIGKFVSFLDSLTADEAADFATTISPMAVDTPDLDILGTRTRAEEGTQWFFNGCSRPTQSEVVVLATLLTIHLTKAELDAWELSRSQEVKR